jgi:CIC family chloride channel protein
MADPAPSRRGLFRIPALAKAPIDLRILGRTLLHAAAVGAAAGLLGALFFYGLEIAQHWLLEGLCGYIPLRAYGERDMGEFTTPYRPWLLWVIPGIGALLGGLLSARFAPETQGGGGDAMIEAFHRAEGNIRRRVIAVKALASMLTLGSGGSGGREGPTMQIGAAIGSVVGRYLRVDTRERRILLVAGCAAGMAAVFRTPLGAALLAVEVLYRDDFESDAMIPALLASVVSYSIFVSFYGESTLFAHAARYPFIPTHLPLYALLAVLVSVVASLFLSTLRFVQEKTKKVKTPPWFRPAIGGVGTGMIAAVFILIVGPRVGAPGQGFGILGGGYGAAQVSILGSSWLPQGWHGVELLALLGLIKIIVTALTVGSGGSAGDFGPSLVIGGLWGGAFGRAAQLLLHDPRIDPGAFALVGMGTFYGGLAHVPVSSLVMVCELAGSYDLLVPLMLAEGIAFVALRRRSLYHAQVATKRDSAAHSHELVADVLEMKRVGEIVEKNRPYVSFTRNASVGEMVRKIAESAWQDVFPVIDAAGAMVGIVDAGIVRTLATERDVDGLAVASDIMQPPMSVRDGDDLHDALEIMVSNGVREIPVVDDRGQILGFLDEADITRVYLQATANAPMSMSNDPPD